MDLPEYLYLLTCKVEDELISTSTASSVNPAEVLEATLGRKSWFCKVLPANTISGLCFLIASDITWEYSDGLKSFKEGFSIL